MSLPRFAMGDSDALAIRLAALVVAGRKTASCFAASQGEYDTPVGQKWILEAPEGRPVALMETMALDWRRFDEVEETFARAEGEGDLSLAFWRNAHETYFRRLGLFRPDMLLCCETFRLCDILDPAFAADAPAHVAAEIAEAHAQPD